MDNSNLTSEDFETLLTAKDWIHDYIEAIDKLTAYYDIFQYSIKTNTVTLDSSIYYAFIQFRETVREYKKVIKHYNELLAYFNPEIEIVKECETLKNSLKFKVLTLLKNLKLFLKQMEADGLNYPLPEIEGSNPFAMPC